MDAGSDLRADGTAAHGPGIPFLFAFVFLGICAWHGWMTLSLFGLDQPWQRLLDAEPIVSGRHPLHLYHGFLGAQSFQERGTSCCFDPAFQAGYPKTPIFDSGSRPAEFFLMLAGGEYQPAAYKIGLAVCCLMVPFLLLIAARGAGLDRRASCLALVFGLLVWWGLPSRRMLEAGDLDQLLAGVTAIAQVGLLVQFHHNPGVKCWLGLLVTGCLGWFAQPVLFATIFPLLLIYYFCVGSKHGFSWHVALFGSLLGGIAVNSFWLVDWFNYSWIRSPLQPQNPVLPHRTFHTLWSAPLWGERPDRILAGILIVAASIGIVVLNETRQRTAARLLGLGAGGFLALAITGISCESLGRLGTARLLVPAFLFAALPAAYAMIQGWMLLCRCLGGTVRAALLLMGLLGTGGYFARDLVEEFAVRSTATTPLEIGLPAQGDELIAAITAHTTTEARILLEDQSGDGSNSSWTSLLPVLTGRAYLGGLDPDASIEHAYASLVDQSLAGRPISAWGEMELQDFCRRYNIGWVIARSPAVIARFKASPVVQSVTSIGGAAPATLIELPYRSFALKGKARLLSADWLHMALSDVSAGTVVLSMHYQEGLRISPSTVRIEKEPDAHDPIPFIRLRVPDPGPVTHLTLTWQPP